MPVNDLGYDKGGSSKTPWNSRAQPGGYLSHPEALKAPLMRKVQSLAFLPAILFYYFIPSFSPFTHSTREVFNIFKAMLG